VGFPAGAVTENEPRGIEFEVDHDCFERMLWPAVEPRFPAFETTKCHRTSPLLPEQRERDPSRTR
jgi:hypothetical protein